MRFNNIRCLRSLTFLYNIHAITACCFIYTNFLSYEDQTTTCRSPVVINKYILFQKDVCQTFLASSHLMPLNSMVRRSLALHAFHYFLVTLNLVSCTIFRAVLISNHRCHSILFTFRAFVRAIRRVRHPYIFHFRS